VRRRIGCRLDANCENLETRVFKRNPLIELRANRGRYVAACLPSDPHNPHIEMLGLRALSACPWVVPEKCHTTEFKMNLVSCGSARG